jgi:hypothetical protein
VVDTLHVMELAAVLIAREMEALLFQGVSCVLGVANANDVVAWSLVLTNPRSIGCEVSSEDSKANLRSRVCNRVLTPTFPISAFIHLLQNIGKANGETTPD